MPNPPAGGPAGSPDEVPRAKVAVTDHLGTEGVVVPAQQLHCTGHLFIRKRHAVWGIANVRMHLTAVGERLAVDPGEDVAALVVDAEPARRFLKADLLEVEQDLAHPFCALAHPLRTVSATRTTPSVTAPPPSGTSPLLVTLCFHGLRHEKRAEGIVLDKRPRTAAEI
jgi:hypothetical protein